MCPSGVIIIITSIKEEQAGRTQTENSKFPTVKEGMNYETKSEEDKLDTFF